MFRCDFLVNNEPLYNFDSKSDVNNVGLLACCGRSTVPREWIDTETKGPVNSLLYVLNDSWESHNYNNNSQIKRREGMREAKQS